VKVKRLFFFIICCIMVISACSQDTLKEPDKEEETLKGVVYVSPIDIFEGEAKKLKPFLG
jgi:uncharacterized membrane protein